MPCRRGLWGGAKRLAQQLAGSPVAGRPPHQSNKGAVRASEHQSEIFGNLAPAPARARRPALAATLYRQVHLAPRADSPAPDSPATPADDGFREWCLQELQLRIMAPQGRLDTGTSLLHSAALEGNVDVAIALLKNGANVNARDEALLTPLHLAVSAGQLDLSKVWLQFHHQHEGQIALLDLVSEFAEGEDSECDAPSALRKAHLDVCKLLIGKNADINALDKQKSTPLHVASSCGRAEFAALLLAQGVEVHLRDCLGQTALHDAARSGHVGVTEMLLEARTDFLAPKAPTEPPPPFEDFWVPPHSLSTPLHVAAEEGHDEIILQLLEHFDADTLDRTGNSSLHLAAINGHEDVAEILIVYGADTAIRNLDGHTAMEAAIDNGQDHVADVLKYHALQRDMSTFRQEHLLKARECRSNDVASTDAACQGRD